jgi:hypothetical protein
MEKAVTHKGSCLCGAVRFTVTGELKPPDACHCTICRKISGHYYSGTDIPRERVTIEGEENVTWYRSSEKARRGFCKICGANMFFDPIYRDWIGLSMGAFDKPTGTKLAIHIFVADKGDYYDIGEDGVPKYETIPPSP